MSPSPKAQDKADKPHIIFVCTGNIFRSLSAEFGMRAADTRGDFTFASAGTNTHHARRLRSDVLGAIAAHDQIDAAGHISRVLNQDIVDGADLIVAMDRDHQKYIRDTFNRHAPLYLEISRDLSEGVPDLPDIVPDYKTNPVAAAAFVNETVTRIMNERPAFLKNIRRYL
ncbi:MAG: hypothetical protein KJ667_09275 [Alphaproteobacteria bacterium]|nr:hypothetical protein [Alphaproteobacteria bacterium]